MPFSADKNPLSIDIQTNHMKKDAHAYLLRGHGGNRYDKQQWNHDHSKYLRLMVINWNWTGRIVIVERRSKMERVCVWGCWAENVLIEFMTEERRWRNCLCTHNSSASASTSLSICRFLHCSLLVYYVWDALRFSMLLLLLLFAYSITYWHRFSYIFVADT